MKITIDIEVFKFEYSDQCDFIAAKNKKEAKALWDDINGDNYEGEKIKITKLTHQYLAKQYAVSPISFKPLKLTALQCLKQEEKFPCCFWTSY